MPHLWFLPGTFHHFLAKSHDKLIWNESKDIRSVYSKDTWSLIGELSISKRDFFGVELLKWSF